MTDEPLVDYLGQGNCRLAGRVGFLAIGTGDRKCGDAPCRPGPRRAVPVDLSGRAGVVCRADRLDPFGVGNPPPSGKATVRHLDVVTPLA